MHPWGPHRQVAPPPERRFGASLLGNSTQFHGIITFYQRYHFSFPFFARLWNQKFGCLQHARHTPVPLHNSQSAMALLHGYPLGLFDHLSGPARYVTVGRLAMAIEYPNVENKLRVRDALRPTSVARSALTNSCKITVPQITTTELIPFENNYFY